MLTRSFDRNVKYVLFTKSSIECTSASIFRCERHKKFIQVDFVKHVLISYPQGSFIAQVDFVKHFCSFLTNIPILMCINQDAGCHAVNQIFYWTKRTIWQRLTA